MAGATGSDLRHKSQFSIRGLLVATAFCALALGWFADRSHLVQQHIAGMAALKATHEYVLTIDGTPGVRLVMNLIMKPAGKKVETISVPYSLQFKANEAEVWIEYLPQGKSGNDGDTFAMQLSKDGVSNIFPMFKGTIHKDSRDTIYVNGDIHWTAGDF